VSEEKVHPKKVLHKYVGVLEAYYETGMEGMHLIMLHDDRGLRPGPKYDDPTVTMNYHSLEWGLVFDKKNYFAANIFDKEGNLVYEGKLTMDRKKVVDAGYRASFIPKEIDIGTWFKYIREEYRAEVYTNLVLDPIRKEYNIEHQAGDLVHDDLTGTDVILTTITLGTDPVKTVGYWVANDYLEGGRHPWEITKIDMVARWRAEIAKEKANENTNDKSKAKLNRRKSGKKS
jgi:hypothetical protein